MLLPKKIKQYWLVVGGCLLLAGGLSFAGYSFFMQKSPQSKENSAEVLGQITSALADSETSSPDRFKTITSSLGYSLSYDSTAFTARAQTTDASSTKEWVSGLDYDGDDLKETRDYSMVKFRPNQADGKSTSLLDNPELVVLTNIRKGYWDESVKKPENADKSKVDIFMDSITKSQLSNFSGTTVSPATDITINGTPFKKIVYTHRSSTYGLDYSTVDYYYFTVQNDRPYYVSINMTKEKDAQLINSYEAIIKTLTFSPPDQSKLSLNTEQAVLSESTGSPLENTSKTIDKIDPSTIYNVVAKNQIAVVRIGSINCFDIDLMFGKEKLSSIKPACTASIGSGSIVSKDGYIATNGHVVEATKYDAINGYLNLSKSTEELASRSEGMVEYLKRSGVMSSAEAEKFIKDIKNSSKPAVARALSLSQYIKDQDIVTSNRVRSYSVQLSNEPLAADITNNSISFKFTNTNKEAKFVAANYDNSSMADHSDISKMVTTDVALLKMEGNAFPVVDLGELVGVKPRDKLTAIGFPGFVDGGLLTKEKITLPSVTQGFVEEIVSQPLASKYQLVVTSVPIAQGNSGGPSFNSAGEQIGLNTYSILPCDNGSCFGSGIIRGINDFKKLVSDNNIMLKTDSSLSKTWSEGVAALQKSNFSKARNDFNQVAKDYSNHYLAVALGDIADSKLQSRNKTYTLVVAAVAIFSGLTLIVVHFIKSRRSKKAAGLVAMNNQVITAQVATTTAPPASVPNDVGNTVQDVPNTNPAGTNIDNKQP